VVGRFAPLRFRRKNMVDHIFSLESELQNILEAAPKAIEILFCPFCKGAASF
jgi:hypothetical protein